VPGNVEVVVLQRRLIFHDEVHVPSRQAPKHKGEHKDDDSCTQQQRHPCGQIRLSVAGLAHTLKGVEDGVGDECIVVHTCNGPVRQKEDEKLGVGRAHTILHPRAVMVHAHHTFVALFAVHGSSRDPRTRILKSQCLGIFLI
jgi:hypothetical protein